MDIASVFETIGTVLGYPAMLLIFWLYIKVKDTEKRLQQGDSDMKEMLKLITDIRIDVAVLRGKKEDMEGEK